MKWPARVDRYADVQRAMYVETAVGEMSQEQNILKGILQSA